jgi:RNA polymerase sigma factor (sigma-70 family)
MASHKHGAVLRSIDRVFNDGSATGLTEGQLLRQFTTRGDEAAFEVLVTRHGPMVLGVCRRLLYDPRDVEDAFQATFLVLLRRAGSLRETEPLSPWLHGVAYRVAARIRARSARRPGEERKVARPEAVESSSDVERHELRGILDEEIGRLPEKYRRPVVLCYLEGQTHEQAAHRLCCSEGSVRGRLDRAREKLKTRLTRRGFAPAAGLTGSALAADMASAAVPSSWISGTVATLGRAATARAIATTVSATVLDLANGVFRAMIVARIKLAASLISVAAVVLAVGGMLTMSLTHSVAQDPGKATVPKQTGATATGRVLDLEGRPIVGARVASGSDRGKATFSETTTDAQGRFTLRDIRQGELILTAQARGHAPDLKKLTIGQDRQLIELRLGPGQTIRGRIVDAHDKPIAGAPIAVDAWRGHHSLNWSTETDAEGRFRWDEAPDDMVIIDLGSLGYYPSKRYWRMSPDPQEKTVTMRRALRIRGAVTDAETGRTVKPFNVIPGYDWGNGDPPSWEYDQARSHSGGAYDITLSTYYPLRVLRIEADGYLPAVSRGFKDDEGETYFNVKLRRGAWIEGVVHLSDGSPLDGADVVMVTPSQPAFIKNGEPPDRKVHRILKTGADGRFTFPQQEPPYSIIVLHDRGFAEQTIDAKPAPAYELRIKPWGRVEGTLRVGSLVMPGTGQPVSLAYERDGDTPKAIPWWSGEARTDASGRFAFERVRPGAVTIARDIPVQTTQSTWTIYHGASAPVDVAPGMTAHPVLGGTGRPVVGKVIAPAEIAGRIDWNQGVNSLIHKEPDVQPGPKKSPRSAPRSHGLVLGRDGSFRIEDVEAGTYDLIIVVDEPARDPQGPPSHEPIGTARRVVTVPQMPGGRSDEPLDLGTIPLEPIKKP